MAKKKEITMEDLKLKKKSELLENAMDFLSQNIQKFEAPCWVNTHGKKNAGWIDVSNNIDKISVENLRYFLMGGELSITLYPKKNNEIHLIAKRKKPVVRRRRVSKTKKEND